MKNWLTFPFGIALVALPQTGARAWASDFSPTFTLEGRLLNTERTVALTDTVDFTIGIYSPDGVCLLYEETVENIDLSLTEGMYHLAVGSSLSSSKRTSRDPGKKFSEIFSNTGEVRASDAATTQTCVTGYTPSSGDRRKVRLTVTQHRSGTTETLSPDLEIHPVPQATLAESAETLQGLSPTQLLQLTGNSTPYTVNTSALDTLLGTNGVQDASSLHTHDSLYARLGSGGSLSLGADAYLGLGSRASDPTNLGAGDAGKTWYDSATQAVKFWDGSAIRTLGTVGSGGSAISALTGDVTTSGAGAATVVQVGGVSAANIAAGATAANSATDANTPGAIVKRDASGKIIVGQVDATGVSVATSLTSPALYGSSSAGGSLTLDSTSDGSKGNILISPAGGKVGIGTTAPVVSLTINDNLLPGSNISSYVPSQLLINDTPTATSSSVQTSAIILSQPNVSANSSALYMGLSSGTQIPASSGYNFNQTVGLQGFSWHSGSGAMTAQIGGAFSVHSKSTSSVNIQLGSQSLAQNVSTGTVTNQYGVYSAAQNTSSGTVSQQMAVYNIAQNYSTGSVTNQFGSQNVAYNHSTGTIAVGTGARNRIYNYGTGTFTTAYGTYSDITNPSGTVTTGYGYYAGTIAATNKWSFYASDANAPNYFAGNVGIGTTSPGYKLDVTGDIRIASASKLYIGTTAMCDSTGCTAAPSDLRYKQNIEPLESSLDKILDLQGVSYDWIDRKTFGDKHQIGFIAQEVEKVYPEIVKTDPNSGFKSVMYDKLVAPLVEAVKTLYDRMVSVETQQAAQGREIASVKASKADQTEIEAVKAENARLKARLDRIESLLNSK